MPVSEATYRQVALEDPEGQWELWWCGRLQQKPPMTVEHGDANSLLTIQFARQLDESEFIVRLNHARLRTPAGVYYIPDLCVVPRALTRRLRTSTRELDMFEEPVPLVVEVWSLSTGTYDLTTRLRDYRVRGDREIWLIHPYERTLTAWRRQPDGSYTEAVHRGGTIQPIALPNVTIDIARLFD